ncbi:MAG: EFR1 family ferrodoxin [Promethearchaeota archaeon]
MKTTIFYYSGTGNSLKIARDISAELENSELIPIAKLWEQNIIIPQSEKIGLVFPLYFMGCPSIIFEFLTKLELNKVNYIFAVATSHHGSSGATLYQINKILKKKSKSLNAGFSIRMPGNYIPMYDIASKESHKRDFEQAKEKIEKLVDIISVNGNKIDKKFLPFIGSFFNKIFNKNVNKSDNNFYADEKCNSCEICEKICPVNNIRIVDGKPEWQHRCQRCLACIHFCPQEAIQYGKKTVNRKRYHHPEITVNDIINQN